jgi:hypothetical protein
LFVGLISHRPSPSRQAALLELRDQMLVRCLRPPLSKEGAFAIMQGFSFEWVAEKARAPPAPPAPRRAAGGHVSPGHVPP